MIGRHVKIGTLEGLSKCKSRIKIFTFITPFLIYLLQFLICDVRGVVEPEFKVINQVKQMFTWSAPFAYREFPERRGEWRRLYYFFNRGGKIMEKLALKVSFELIP